MNSTNCGSDYHLRVMQSEEVVVVSGGHPVIVAGAAIYGGYQFGKAVGKGARKLQNWVQERRAS